MYAELVSKGLTKGKAAGFDMISAEMIKVCGTSVREVFLSLSNLCWRMGKVSTDWRRAVPSCPSIKARDHVCSALAIEPSVSFA